MIWRIYLQKARNENALGNKEKSMQCLNKMLRCHPPLHAKVLCLFYMLKENDVSGAQTVYDEFILHDKKMQEPDRYDKKGRLVIRHDVMEAKINHGLLLWKTGDLNGAIAELEYVHGRMHTTTLYCNLGFLYILKGDYEKALKYNLKAYDFSSGSNGICDNLGCTYYHLGKMEEAREIYEEMMEHEKKPSFPECYYNYGRVLCHFKDYKKAREMFLHAKTLPFDGFSNVTVEQIHSALKNLPQTEHAEP